MGDVTSIQTTNGIYQIRDARISGIYPVVGTQVSVTSQWTGEISIDHLYDGLTIAYYLPEDSAANVTLQLTLSDGTETSSLPVYDTGTDRMGTQYAAGSTIILTYWGSGTVESARWTHSSNSSGGVDVYTRDFEFDHGEQLVQRNIIFKNDNGTNPHNSFVFGGDPESNYAIGIYDGLNDISVAHYDDSDTTLCLGSNVCDTRIQSDLYVDKMDGTRVYEGETRLVIGNNTSTGTAGNSTGHLRIYSDNTNCVNLSCVSDMTESRYIKLPDNNGILALTSQLTAANVGALPTAGGTMTGGIIMNNNSIMAKDKSGTTYSLIKDNGTNIWIGAPQTTAYHHHGETFISAGYDPATGKGNETIKISVPNDTNNGGTNYKVYHEGNLVGATTSTRGLMSASDKQKLDGTGNIIGLSYTVVSTF